MPRSLALLLAAVASSLALLAAPAALGSSPNVVVSQVFAGGGNSGAPFSHDFVELFNRGSTSVDVGGWTIQYASAAGTTWQATALSGSIPPGGYYLVQLAGGTSGSPLPAADAFGATNLANTGGKVAVVRDSTPLSCGSSPGSCAGAAHLADLIGYGPASDYEGGGPAPALSNTTALLRAEGGCTDTDGNSADVSTAPPAPRNSSSPAAPCESEPPPPPGEDGSESATVDVDVDAAISIALERAHVGFGRTRVGETPAPVSEHVTVSSNHLPGYTLTVRRTAFTPADLPLGISAAGAPAGGELGPGLGGGAIVPIPVPPALDLLVGTTSGPSAGGGDVWPLSLGFAAPIPQVPAGRYSAVVTFTVIGR